MANLGRVAYVHRGAYDSGALYEKYDVVYESTTNSAYAYINNVATIGNAVTNETYWALLVSGSELNSTAENMPYLFIKYSENKPTTDGEISDTTGNWMGVYIGTSRIAPTTYNSYIWHNVTGNVMYATFDIDFDTGELVMTIPDGYTGPTFAINDETGE